MNCEAQYTLHTADADATQLSRRSRAACIEFATSSRLPTNLVEKLKKKLKTNMSSRVELCRVVCTHPSVVVTYSNSAANSTVGLSNIVSMFGFQLFDDELAFCEFNAHRRHDNSTVVSRRR